MNQTVKLFLLSFFLVSGVVFAEKIDSCYAGIYVTQSDFLQNRASFKINENVSGYNLGFTFPADLTFELKIITPDSIMRIKPGTVYGYFECGSVYRYSFGTGIEAQDGYYKIEEIKEMVIYSCPLLYGSETFYSLNPTSDIKRLTKKNLEADFAN
jgi:hypothetical protein